MPDEIVDSSIPEVSTPSTSPSTPPPEPGDRLPPTGTTAAPPTATPGTSPPTTSTPGKWFDSLPEDIRGNERLTRFGSQEEAMRAFATASLADGVPESYTLPPNTHAGWSDFAKQHKLTQGQLDSVLDVLNNADNARMVNARTEHNRGLQALREEWGPDTEKKLQAVNSVFQHVKSLQPVYQYMKERGEENNPLFIRALSDIGTMFNEGRYIKSGSSSTIGQSTDAKSIAHRWYPNEAPQGN